MGEARQKALRATATKRFHITEQEQFCLTLYLLNSIQPKDRHDQRRYTRAFNECQLSGVRQQVSQQTKLGANMTIDDFSADTMVEVVVANDTLEYVLEVTDKPMVGLHALVLLPLQERLIAVKNDVYQSPFEESAPVGPASSTQIAATA